MTPTLLNEYLSVIVGWFLGGYCVYRIVKGFMDIFFGSSDKENS